MLVLYSLSCHSANPHSINCSSTVQCLLNLMSVPPTQAATENLPHSQLHANDGPLTPPRPSGGPPKVKDTPVSHKQAGSYRYSSTSFATAVDRNVKLGKEVNGYVVGPMPVEKFLEKYVPEHDATEPFVFKANEAKELQNSLAVMKDENNMYTPWIAWMKQYVGKYHFADVHAADMAQLCGRGIRPDVVLHQNSLKDDNSKYQWHNVELIGEFKAGRDDDPFVDDDPESMCSNTKHGASTLGQITSYATCHMSMQCRTHVFQFLVINDYARLLRWDRSGVVVTAKIPLSNRSLTEFFWRFAHLGSKERGWDSTVCKPLQEEIDQAKPALDAAEAKLRRTEESRSSYTKIIFGESAYVVHRMFYSGLHSPFGRGTRGYAAYSLKDRKVVFLKSTWRVDGNGRIPEHETLKKLHDAGVQHIPTVFESWEDEDEEGTHVTQTQDAVEWMMEDAKRKRLRKLRHYILVLNELGRDVTTFKSSKELLVALGDAAEAHEQADDMAKILHRDISPGNVLITDEGRGLLIDWDLAKDRSETAQMAQGESQPERTGTYQFMAARFVTGNAHLDCEPHNRLDDIESMFHVLQWIILRYIDHGMAPNALRTVLQEYFDMTVPRPGMVPSCVGRRDRIQNDLIWNELRRLHPLLRDLLKQIRRIIATRYIEPDKLEETRMRYETMLNAIPDHARKGMANSGPIELEDRNKLDVKGWLATALRVTANDPGCPTTDEGVPQIDIKGTKSEIIPTGPEYHHSSEKPPRKAHKGYDGQRNPARAAKTKANSSLTEADSLVDHDANENNDEGSSSRPQERKSATRKRKKNTK